MSDVLTRLRTRPRTELVVVAVVVVLVLVALLMAATIDDDDPRHRVAVDRGGRDRAVLTVASGADTITVRADDVGGDLAVVSTPDRSRVLPIAEANGDDLRVTTADARADGDRDGDDGFLGDGFLGGDGNGDDDVAADGPADVEIRLSRDVRWDVVVDGGSQRLTIALRDATSGRVEVRGGQGSIDAVLPQPEDLFAFVVAGGAGTVSLHAPAGVPARLDVGNGAGTAVLDADRRQGVAGGTSLTTPDWTGAGNRIEVDATSGVGTVTLDRDRP